MYAMCSFLRNAKFACLDLQDIRVCNSRLVAENDNVSVYGGES